MSKPMSKKAKGTSSQTEKPTSGKCGKKNYTDYLKGTDNCFGCGKSRNKVRDLSNVGFKYKGFYKSQGSGSN